MAATMSALRVVAPVARVSASKARVARSAVAAKVSLRGPFFHLDRDGCESPPIGAVIPPRPPRAWTHRTVPFLRAARQGSLRRGPRLLRRRLRASRGCPQGTPRPETPPRRCRDFCHRCRECHEGSALASASRRSRRPSPVFARFIPPAAMRTRVRASMFDGARVSRMIGVARPRRAPARRPEIPVI